MGLRRRMPRLYPHAVVLLGTSTEVRPSLTIKYHHLHPTPDPQLQNLTSSHYKYWTTHPQLIRQSIMTPPSQKPVALVVGASRGIGRQIAVDLASNGYAGIHPNRTKLSTPFNNTSSRRSRQIHQRPFQAHPLLPRPQVLLLHHHHRHQRDPRLRRPRNRHPGRRPLPRKYRRPPLQDHICRFALCARTHLLQQPSH